MKRLLAGIGFLYFGVQLAASFLPSAALLPLAAFFIAGSIPALFCHGKYRQHILVLFAVPAVALVMRSTFIAGFVVPLREKAGTEAEIHAVVMEAAPGYRTDCVRATVLVDSVNGKSVFPFRLGVDSLPYSERGDVFTSKIKFKTPAINRYTLGRFADGIFLEGDSCKDYVFTGKKGGVSAAVQEIRARMVSGLCKILPKPYSQISASMTVGEQSLLSPETKNLFRRAGISHILVVSGLHLSAVSGMVYWLLRRVALRRNACACSIAAVAAFMVLEGFTPSVVRSGTAMIILYAGGLFNRKSDALTSLGFAALLLCLVNPYACADAGLLLSFSATIGVLAVSGAKRRYNKEHPGKSGSVIGRAAMRTAWAAAVPAAAMVTTLPVLIAMNAGVSFLSLITNLIVVPFMPAAVALGFITGICACVPFLTPLAHLSGLFLLILLRMVTAVARAADLPYAFVHISGSFAILTCLLFAFLVWTAWKMHVPFGKASFYGLFFLSLSFCAYSWKDAKTVHLHLAGNNANPALVVMQGMNTAVIFRGSESNAAGVQQVLERYNRTHTDVLIDLRSKGNTDTLAERLSARQAVSAETDLINRKILHPFHAVNIYIKHQSRGNFACVEANGSRVGVSGGSTEFTGYPPFDIYIAGSGLPENLQCSYLVLPQEEYQWLDRIPAEIPRYRAAEIDLMKENSIRIDEVGYDFE